MGNSKEQPSRPIQKYLSIPNSNPLPAPSPRELRTTLDMVVEEAKLDIKRAIDAAGDSREAPSVLQLPNTKDLTEHGLKTLNLIHSLEEVARDSAKWGTWDKFVTENTSSQLLFIRFGGPGTYHRLFKDDRFNQFPWAAGLERIADDGAAIAAIYAAGVRSGEDFSAFTAHNILDDTNPNQSKRIEEVRAAVESSNIRFVHIGTLEESASVQRTTNSSKSFIPNQVVDYVTSPKIDNTLDQITHLRGYLRSYFADHPNQNMIPIMVDFAPRLARVLYKLQAHADTIPSEMPLHVFPIATPGAENHELARIEARGTIGYYYVIGESSDTPFPHQVVIGQ